MKLSPAIIYSITLVIAMEVIGGVTGWIVGRDLGQLVTFFTIINGAAIPAVTALVKLEQTDKKIEGVNQKVNGHLAELTQLAVQGGHTTEAVTAVVDKIPDIPHA